MFELCFAIPELYSLVFLVVANGSMLFSCRPGYTCPLALLIFWGRLQSSLVFLKLNLKVSCSFIFFYYIITFQTAHTNYSPFAPNAYAVAHEPMFQPQHDGIRPCSVATRTSKTGQYGPGNGYKLFQPCITCMHKMICGSIFSNREIISSLKGPDKTICHNRQLCPCFCYGQSWYKCQIRIDARVLIYRDLRDRVVDGGSWSDSHTGWTKVHLSITQEDQTNVPNQKFGWKPYSF